MKKKNNTFDRIFTRGYLWGMFAGWASMFLALYMLFGPVEEHKCPSIKHLPTSRGPIKNIGPDYSVKYF